MANALIVGSVALDTVETPYGSETDILGGSAAYGSVAASFFAPAELVAVVGKDFPRQYVSDLEQRGVNTEGLVYEDGETFRWSGYYERTMENAHTNTTCLNVFEHFRPDLNERQAESRFVFLANIHPELQLYVVKQLRNPEFVALDTMNFWIEGTKQELTKVIKKCTLLLMNEDEARQYCETANLIVAGRVLRSLGPNTVVIKKGEHGSLVFQKDRILSVPAYPLSALKDPTGAGDTFAGTLTGYLARLGRTSEENIHRAVAVGSVMASFVVEDFSLRRMMRIQPGEIQERVNHLLDMTRIPPLEGDTLAGLGLEKQSPKT